MTYKLSPFRTRNCQVLLVLLERHFLANVEKQFLNCELRLRHSAWKVQSLSREVIGVQSLEQVGQCRRSLASSQFCAAPERLWPCFCGAAWAVPQKQNSREKALRALRRF